MIVVLVDTAFVWKILIANLAFFAAEGRCLSPVRAMLRFRWYELLVLATSTWLQLPVVVVVVDEAVKLRAGLKWSSVSSGNGKNRSEPPGLAVISRGIDCAPWKSLPCGPPTQPKSTRRPRGSVKDCDAIKSLE